jgi:hypothetical protein
MSRFLPIASVATATLALSTPGAAAPPHGAVWRAFAVYVRKHMPPVGSPELAGSAVSCNPTRHGTHRYRCQFEPEEPGVPKTCIVKGTVIEVKPRDYRFRSIKVAPSCPRWQGRKP